MINKEDWHFEKSDEIPAFASHDEHSTHNRLKILAHKPFCKLLDSCFDNDKPIVIEGLGIISEDSKQSSCRVHYLQGKEGVSHTDIYAPGVDRTKAISGFVTTCGHFVTRYQAARIQEILFFEFLKEEDRLKIPSECCSIQRDLYSNNIDWAIQEKAKQLLNKETTNEQSDLSD